MVDETAHTPEQAKLAALWEAHMAAEFEARDADAAAATMTEDAWVNHVPVLTGGVGRAAARDFYARHFIPRMPPDTRITPVSRTIGTASIVDELIFSFTHTVEIDWMIPGVAPTGKPVEVALVVIVGFDGDKVSSEHIYWDQASVLAQLGLIDAGVLPVAGSESARKVMDPASVPSNGLIARART